MQESLKKFMTEGFKRFPEAMATAEMFANTLDSRLRSCFEERTTWAPLLMKASEKISRGDPHLGEECWVCIYKPGSLGKHRIYVEAGYWWNAAGVELPLIAYVSLEDLPSTLRRFEYKPRNRRVKAKVISTITRLYLEPDASGDVAGDINTLLDELQLAAQMLLKQ